jgi:IclR family transcriptional regulator, pca regulon regulatory protein
MPPRKSTRSTSKRPKSAQPVQYTPTLAEPRYSQSLERGFAILGCFTPEHPELGIADIADALGMSRPTTHRYVVTLLALGYLEQVASRKYRLGLRVADLGITVMGSIPVADHARPHLEQLRQQTGRAVMLSVLDGTEAVVLERLREFQAPRERRIPEIPPGTRLPLSSTATGKALISGQHPDNRERLLREIPRAKAGPNAITTASALRLETERTAESDFAVDDEESASEVQAIAMPIRDDTGEAIAAVEVRAHFSQMSLPTMVEVVSPRLRVVCDLLSVRLGYNADRAIQRRD